MRLALLTSNPGLAARMGQASLKGMVSLNCESDYTGLLAALQGALC